VRHYKLPSTIRVSICWLGFLLLLIPWALNAQSYTLQFKTDNLAVYATQPLSPDIQATCRQADSKIDDLQMNLGIYVNRLAEVRVVTGRDSYHRLAMGKSKIIEFSDAFYSGKDQLIYIRNRYELADDFLHVLLHEYVHWYLDNIFTHSPLWFHEGVAVNSSGQMGFDGYLIFLQDSFLGKHSDLYRLSYSYPRNQSEWKLFYLSSAMAVNYMSQNHKQEWQRFWELVATKHRHHQKAVFSECFNMAYHLDLFDFHNQFNRHVRNLRLQYLIFSFNALLAMLLPLFLILAHRRKRKKMKLLPELDDFQYVADDEEAKDELPEQNPEIS